MRKTIIITGGNRGIGKTLVDNLKKIYNICVISKTISYRESKYFLSMPCDITSIKDIIRIFYKIKEKFNIVDILINNAGLMNYSKIENIIISDFNLMFDVNVKGTLLFSQIVLPIMKQQKRGYIINIGSTRAITGAPNKGIYSMTKFALRSLTQTIQQEYKKYGIKSTIICPGMINTESTRKKYTEKELKKKDLVEELDIVKTIKYLLSLSPKAYIPEIIIGGKL